MASILSSRRRRAGRAACRVRGCCFLLVLSTFLLLGGQSQPHFTGGRHDEHQTASPQPEFQEEEGLPYPLNPESLQDDRDLQNLYPNLFFWNMWQQGEQVALQEGAIFGVDQESVEDVWHHLSPITDALGLTGPVDSFNAAWTGFWMQGAGSCLADDAERLAEAVAAPQCKIVLLVPGRTYDIEADMDVYDDTTIIGSPTLRPIIDGIEAERTFIVYNGARLELRHILFYQGDGDEILDSVRTRFGGTALVYPGGSVFAFDCLFTLQPYREAFFNTQPEFIFGGDILMTGGRVDLIACSLFAVTPGFANSVSTELGGSVLVLAGTFTMAASNFMTSQIFAYNIGVGMHLAVFGGAIVMNGVTHTANLIFAAQGICGRNIFLGGGVGIFTGVAVTDTMAHLAFFGAGLSIFIGGGLGVFTGCEITLINALSDKNGVGLAVALGGGMGLFYGVPFSKDLGISQFNLLGLFVYAGAGRIAFIGCPFAHQNAIAALQCLGGGVFLGAGQMLFIGCVMTKEAGIFSFTGLGGDLFLGAGDITMVSTPFTTAAGIFAFVGQGMEVYVGAGYGSFCNVPFSANIGLNYASEKAVAIYVGGRECEVLTQEEGDLWIKEKGYATCKAEGEGEGEAEGEGEGEDEGRELEANIGERRSLQDGTITLPSLTGVAMKNVKAVKRVGGFNEAHPLVEASMTVFLDQNTTSCSLCGLKGMEINGPKATKCSTTDVCDSDDVGPQPGVKAFMPVKQLQEKTTTKLQKLEGKLFASRRRMARSLGADTEDPSAPIVTGGSTSVGTSSDTNLIPATYVVVAQIALACTPVDVGNPCVNTTELQLVLEEAWLADEEDSRVVVEEYRSPAGLMDMLGIPNTKGVSLDDDALSVPTDDECPQLLQFIAYAHTTDSEVYDLLKKRLTNQKDDTIAQILHVSGNDGFGPFCQLDVRTNGTYHVPPSAIGQSSYYSSKSVDSSSDTYSAGLFSLPRVWVNINDPVVTVGSTYEIVISHFREGDRVGLQLLPSEDNDAGASTAWALHYFKAFNATKGNDTWMWTVRPRFFQANGVYYLKAFDKAQPGRFALTQAFDLEVPLPPTSSSSAAGTSSVFGNAKAQGSSSSSSSSTASKKNGWKAPSGSDILERLSFQGSRERRHRQLNQDGSVPAGHMSDVTLVRGMLAMQNDTAAVADLWKSLVDLPMTQEAFRNASMVKTMLERAPVLQASPSIKALDANDGWSDPIKVQSSITKAMKDFINMATSVMASSSSEVKGSSSSSSKDWPNKILDGMDARDFELSDKLLETGDQGALGELMDNQAAKQFGGYKMSEVLPKDGRVVQEFKDLLRSSKLLKDVLNDRDVLRALQME